MSRATMNTSSEFSGTQQSDTPENTARQWPLKVAIIGDFSGRESRGISDPSTIGSRDALALNKDSFHRVFDLMEVRLRMPFVEESVSLMEFDDLHPDYLYKRVPLFKEFIRLQKQLLTPGQFEQAANEIQDLSTFKHQKQAASETSEADSMLDAILSGSNYQEAYRKSTTGQIDQLIKDIVAPYVEPKEDPRQDKLLDAINAATSETMRKLMHNSAFQEIEASWRSLHMLTKRLDSTASIQIDIIDISKQELLEDFACADDELERSQIFKRLISSQTALGNIPYNVIVGDFYIEDSEKDLALLIDLGTIAEAAGSVFISGADTKLAECPTLAGSSDPDDWYYKLSDDFKSGWQAIREYSASEHIALVAPKFLLRLPYGENTSTTEAFNFEELTEESGHKYYLWGNSAYLVLLKLCESYLSDGMQINPSQLGDVESLPMHIFKKFGSQHIKPCAETVLTDSGASQFLNAGMSLVRSVQNTDRVQLTVKSLNTSGELLGPWTTVEA